MTSDGSRDRRGAVGLPGFELEPHHCFACGELNEHGLHLELHVSPEGSWTETTLASRFQGWESVAHGGIVTTLLDEVMAWSVIGRGTWGVTARLNVAFRKPVPVDRPIRAEGRVVEDRRRTIRTTGRVLDAETGETLAEGEGTFLAPPPEELARLKARYRLRRVDGDRDGHSATSPDSATWPGVASSPDVATTQLIDITENVDHNGQGGAIGTAALKPGSPR